MSKLYFRAIAWIIPVSWLHCLYVMGAAIAAAYDARDVAEELGGPRVGSNIIYAFSWWTFMGAFECLAWFLAPRVVKFYKWDEQSWWNFNNDDVPGVLPSQLGDFIEY